MSKGNTEDFRADLTHKMCDRIKECCKHRGIDRNKLSVIMGYSRSYIDTLLSGGNRLTEEKVLEFATALNVNPKYLMCETDIAMPLDQDETAHVIPCTDNFLLRHFESLGHTLLFHVVRLRSDEKPKTINAFGKEFVNWESIKETATLDMLKDFTLSDPHCVLEDTEGKAEVIISDVTVNGTQISFGAFVFLVNRINDYIDFTLSNIGQFRTDTLTQSGTNTIIDLEIRNRPSSLLELTDEEIIKDILSHAVEVELKAEDGTIFKAMRIDKRYLKPLGMKLDYYFTSDEEYTAEVLKNFLRAKRNKK